MKVTITPVEQYSPHSVGIIRTMSANLKYTNSENFTQWSKMKLNTFYLISGFINASYGTRPSIIAINDGIMVYELTLWSSAELPALRACIQHGLAEGLSWETIFTMASI